MPIPFLAPILGGLAAGAAGAALSGGGGGSQKGGQGDTRRFPIYTPQQQKLLNQSLGLAQRNLGQLSAPVNLPGAPAEQINYPGVQQPLNIQELLANLSPESIERQTINQFQSQIAPNLAQQFASSGQSLSGSGFQGSLGAAKLGLAERLAALRYQHRGQLAGELATQNQQQLAFDALRNQLAQSQGEYGLNRYSTLANTLLQGQGLQRSGIQQQLSAGLAPQFETAYFPRQYQPGLFQSLAPGLGQGIGMALPSLLSKYLGG
jgi:hypothetical protein